MRLSVIEELRDEEDWEQIREFVDKYGGELFHSRMLTLGNVRAILHYGIDLFLEHLAERQDVLHPSPLLADLSAGRIGRDLVFRHLELIYGAVIDKFDRFLEYNSTTTQSDYGEKFYCLLDFLRVEARYDRDAWDMLPVRMAHEKLSVYAKGDAAKLWETNFQLETFEAAEEHLADLHQLEDAYGMRLPSMNDHLNERFVKPLAVDRMLALVPRAMQDSRHQRPPSKSFEILREEIDRYLDCTFGSGIDIPEWMQQLQKQVEQIESDLDDPTDLLEPQINRPAVTIGLREMRRQLKTWAEPLLKPSDPD